MINGKHNMLPKADLGGSSSCENVGFTPGLSNCGMEGWVRNVMQSESDELFLVEAAE